MFAILVAFVMAFSINAGTVQAATITESTSSTSSTGASQDADEDILVSFLEDAGVPADQRNRLIQKWRTGEPWDSQIAHSKAASQRVVEHETYTETVDIFADGSIVISTVDKPRDASGSVGGVSPLGVSQCSVTSTNYANYYNNCRASMSNGVVTLRFDFNYVYPRGYASYISWSGNASGTGVGIALSYNGSSQSQPNVVRHNWQATPYFPVYSRTVYLQATVVGGNATLQYN